jgi:hypothetical protein
MQLMGTTVRALTILLTGLLVLQSIPRPLQAQTPEPAKLNIVILEGEGAINNIRQRTARESIVQVEDENHRPIGGAVVTFFLPDNGASGVFTNGSRSLTITTDQSGKAVARVRPNQNHGNMQIRVNANYKGLTANSVINQSNVMGAAAAGGAISAKLLALIIVGAAGAATAGALVATRGNGGAATVPPTVITPGTPTVGAPR